MRELARGVWEVSESGGPIMIALAILAVMLYRNLIGLFVFLRDKRLADVERSGVELGTFLGAISDRRFHLAAVARSQLRYARALLVAAPLLGLLGTVMGMLDTFKGLAEETGQETATAVADGIKVALVTTQTGLMIAILGIFFTQWIGRLYRARDLELSDLRLQALRHHHAS